MFPLQAFVDHLTDETDLATRGNGFGRRRGLPRCRVEGKNFGQFKKRWIAHGERKTLVV